MSQKSYTEEITLAPHILVINNSLNLMCCDIEVMQCSVSRGGGSLTPLVPLTPPQVFIDAPLV